MVYPSFMPERLKGNVIMQHIVLTLKSESSRKLFYGDVGNKKWSYMGNV
jgi:hypothetical protein